MRHRIMRTPIGPLTLVVDAEALVAVITDGQRHAPGPQAWGSADPTAASEAVDQLTQYFAGLRTSFALPLAAAGSDFQQRVWAVIAQIPFGQTRTYGQLADLLGAPGAARAVGAATGRNPLSIVVPCHRVVGASGSLTGYAGGLDRKRWLLQHEQAVLRDHAPESC